MKRSNIGVAFLSIVGIVIVLLLILNLVSPDWKKLINPIIHNSLIPQKIQQMFITPTPVDIVKIKKDSLAQFYNGLVQAEVDKDYEKDYEYYKPSLGVWVTKEEYIAYEKARMGKKPIISSELIIHHIFIDGNNGTIDRTRTFCFTKECKGKDKMIDHALRKFVYIYGKWSKIPDKQPSERALKAVSFIFANSSPSDKKKIIENGSYGSNNDTTAIHFRAIYYDENPEELSLEEAAIEKYKTEASRPVINYQPPQINVQTPQVIQQAPINNSIRCTTNTIGSYTYTNCY